MDIQEKIRQLVADINRYMQENNSEEVIRSCNELIKLDSNIKEAYFNRGLAYAHLKKREEAIINYTEAINLDIKINTNPTFKEPYNSRGNAYNDLGKYDEAIVDLDKAINLDPTYANAYNNRGISYAKLEKYDEAIKDFDKAIDLDPTYKKAYKNLASTYNNRGIFYVNLGIHNEAIKDFDKAINLDPTFKGAYNNKEISYAKLEEHNKATELDPNYKETDNNLKKHDETLESVGDGGTSEDFVKLDFLHIKEIHGKKHGITINFFDFLTQLSHPYILWGVLILYIIVLYPLSEMVDTINIWSLKFFIQWASLIIDSIKPVLVFVAGIVINDYVNHIKNKK